MTAVAKRKWTRPDYRKRLEELLRLYPYYKRSLEDEKRGLFPSCVSSMELRVVGGKKEYSSTTEKYGIKRAERRELVEMVDYALTFLDPDEKEVIEHTYFVTNRPKMYIVYNELNMSQASYYRIKNRAIKKMALVLGLI